VNGTITRYVYDGPNIVTQYDGSWNVTAKYIHTLDVDDPLTVTQGANTYYYHKDGAGSVVDLTDASGNVVKGYTYRSFGEIYSETGGLVQPFAFTGREYDSESGLYFHRARYYDARAGRFLTKDPIGFLGGDTNLYRYVQNNPLNLADPWGLKIRWNQYIFNNLLVIRNLIRLNQEIINLGIADAEFTLSVSGGDRYVDSKCKHRSATTHKIEPKSDKNSPTSLKEEPERSICTCRELIWRFLWRL
jgi:RHS repeat-associated protein